MGGGEERVQESKNCYISPMSGTLHGKDVSAISKSQV